MRVIIQPDPEAASRLAADILVSLIARQPGAVVGLPTGSTPRRWYELLVEAHRAGRVDFERVSVVMADAFVGLDPEHPSAAARHLRRMFFDHVPIAERRRHLPDGNAGSSEHMIARFQRSLEHAGGVDLFVAGVGDDGHLASNDPGSSLRSRMRVVPVSLARRPYLVEVFGSADAVPTHAVTLGVADFLDARACLLLAFGASKAQVVAQIVEGPLTAHVPASALQNHPNVTVLVDESAAVALRDATAYREAWELERGSLGM